MFAIVNSDGDLFLKVDDSNRAPFESAGSSQHGKMPHFLVPDKVLADSGTLLDWAKASFEVARAAKKK
jgi:TfoX/Sxy family transcriptional regulator of competence genes